MWAAVILLAAVAGCLLIEVASSAASDQQPTVRAAGSDSTLIVAGEISRDTFGLYLVDLARRRICVYQWLAGSRKLRLMAVRNYSYDRELDDYNTEPPTREIKDLVTQAQRLRNATTRP